MMNLIITAEEREILIRMLRGERRPSSEYETPEEYFAAEERSHEAKRVLENKLLNLKPGQEEKLTQELEQELEDLERSAMPGASENLDWLPTGADIDGYFEED